MMRWQDEQRGDVLVARVAGQVDESTAQAFAGSLESSIDTAAAAPGRKLIVDLAALEYMSSRGLRALTLAKRKADSLDVLIHLAGPNAIMREILAISRYDRIFAISDTVDAAL